MSNTVKKYKIYLESDSGIISGVFCSLKLYCWQYRRLFVQKNHYLLNDTILFIGAFRRKNRFILKWLNGGRWLPKKDLCCPDNSWALFSFVDHLYTHGAVHTTWTLIFDYLWKKYQMEWSLNHLKRSPGPLSCDSMISLLLRCILYLFTIN